MLFYFLLLYFKSASIIGKVFDYKFFLVMDVDTFISFQVRIFMVKSREVQRPTEGRSTGLNRDHCIFIGLAMARSLPKIICRGISESSRYFRSLVSISD